MKGIYGVVAALALVPLAHAGDTYLALGDSIAFGYQPVPAPLGNVLSYADRGYVSAVADRIGALQGARPTVVNLSIPGETSTSFFSVNSNAPANLNYPFLGNTQSQSDKAANAIANATSGGNTLTHVSFALGANDLLGVLNSTGFTSLPQSQQLAQINTALLTVTAAYTQALTSLRAALPNAQLLLPGYYNPFPASAPNGLGALGDLGVTSLNAVIQSQASKFGGTYVDFFTPIEGNQLSLTYIGTQYQNIHPNDAGYAVLGAAAAARVQAVPEPATFALLGGGLLLARRRRRRA